MRVLQAFSRRGQRGYSLIEALVVVALVGVFSVIAVPNFMQMYRSSRLKTSLRNFTTDVRWARQKAVSEATIIIVSFPPVGATSDNYRFYRGQRQPDNSITATDFFRDGAGNPVARTLEERVFFSSTNYTDDVDTTALRSTDEDYLDIIFLSNGTLLTAAGTPQVQITTDMPIPIPTFNVNFSVAGGVKAERP
ncbi:MAG: pilus assembly FimT family protein [Thermoanaerobaculia bacterium]